MKNDLFIVWICISLITSEIEHLSCVGYLHFLFCILSFISYVHSYWFILFVYINFVIYTLGIFSHLMFVFTDYCKRNLKFLFNWNCHTFYSHFLTLVFSLEKFSYSQPSKYLCIFCLNIFVSIYYIKIRLIWIYFDTRYMT